MSRDMEFDEIIRLRYRISVSASGEKLKREYLCLTDFMLRVLSQLRQSKTKNGQVNG